MDNTKTARCPVCREKFDIDDSLSIGDTTYCPECGAELKMLEISPPVVEEIDSEDENYDDTDIEN
ncbi:MAG: hypothetical protein ABH868_00255 [bacterium]